MNKTKTMMLALMVTGAFMAFLLSATAATFVVNTTADTQDAVPADGICADSLGACSLRAAITQANALAGADIITLPAGTYTTTIAGSNENANANGDFDITQPLTINGAAAATTIIQANAAPNTATERTLHLLNGSGAVTINDVTIQNGQTVTNSSGAGIRMEGATTNLTINRVVVTANKSAGAGGGISFLTNGEVLTATDCTISNNSAGSAIAGSGSTGAGINMQIVGTLNLTNTVVTGNNLTSSVNNTFGGGVNVTGAGATATLTGCTISNNSSNATGSGFGGFAGGIYNQQANVTLTNCVVSGNTVTGVAIAAHAGIRTLSQVTAATTNIINSTIRLNEAVDTCGGVANFAVGGVACTTNITGSTISENSVSAADGGLSGIDNESTDAGGDATVNLTNSTVSGNTGPFAAGIYINGKTATVNLDHTTVAANAAEFTGGGFYQDVDGGTINLKNSIVADNTAPAGPDIFATVNSQDYNHIEDTSDGSFSPMANDVTGTDPLLGPLADNGGPTFTHLPATTSPVVNTIASGANGCGTTVTVDQRGLPRPAGSGCEKGSVEVQPAVPSSVVSRKIHGANPFDINLPLTGGVGVECRSGGPSNDHQIVFTFPSAITFTGASVAPGVGSVNSTSGSGTTTATVNLTGVTNQQTITVTLEDVNNGAATADVSVQMGVLLGDVTGAGGVNATDVSATKLQSGQAATAANFRADVIVNGSISSTDVTAVKLKSGTALPP